MDDFISFLSVNWQWIISVLIGLTSLLVVVFKRSVKYYETIKEYICDRLPFYINLAEDMFSAGSTKKQFVVESICKLISDRFGCNSDRFISFINASIEAILSTPMKKGE